MSKRIVLVRHENYPPDDRAFTYFTQNGFDVEIKRPFAGDVLGTLDDDVVGSVVYGGPFNVFEEDKHPFLHDENSWIKQCIDTGVPLLGICQGAQSIARVLGAKAGPRPDLPHEFGYYEIMPSPEAVAEGFLLEPMFFTESHFHEFEVPEGGTLLGYSKAFPQQAFRYGEMTYGFQFHPEQTMAGFRRWQAEDWAHYGKPGSQTKDQQDALMLEHDKTQGDWFVAFLGKLFGNAKG